MSQTIQVNHLVSFLQGYNPLENKECNGIATQPFAIFLRYMVETTLQTILMLVAIKVQNNNKDIENTDGHTPMSYVFETCFCTKCIIYL